jgi:hypothetical protein
LVVELFLDFGLEGRAEDLPRRLISFEVVNEGDDMFLFAGGTVTGASGSGLQPIANSCVRLLKQ